MAKRRSTPHQPLAYHDPEFLESTDARPIRLLAEYLEPARRFRRENIQDTVVFFGSARVHSRQDAERALRALQKKRGPKPADHAMLLKRSRKAIAWSRYYEEARELARMLTSWSLSLEEPRRRFVVCSGGGPGIMEAANRGAFDVGAKSIGFNITLPMEQEPNAYTTPDLTFRFHYFAIRKMHLAMRANALAVFPGGFGTLDELFEILTLIQTRKAPPVPVVLFGRDYWRKVINFETLIEHEVISPQDLKLFDLVDSAEEAWEAMRHRGLKAHTPADDAICDRGVDGA